MEEPKNICFIDFETTGVDVFKDEPIELGAVLVDEEQIIKMKFFSRIKPRTKARMRKSAYEIHGLSEKDFTEAPSQKEVLTSFFEQMGTNYRFAGWNINFDVTFFRRMCSRNGYMHQYNKIFFRHIDVQSLNYLSNKLGLYRDSQNQSLSDLSKYFGFERSENHNALEDTLNTFYVYKEIVNLFKKNQIKLIKV